MIAIRITREPLDPLRARAVMAPRHGAVLVFEGVVRDRHDGRAVTHIDYHAYEPMALKEMEAIVQEVQERHDVPALWLEHRIGVVKVGEASLLVGLGSEHRGPAIAALADLVDQLKRRVPIWKHEFGPDGAHWVGGVVPAPADDGSPLQPGEA